MTDPISTSRTARESLARGLNALQADPSVPPQLIELAAPIAQAMGALHQIERGGPLVPHAETALNHVRGALQRLQAQPPSHQAVATALEAVAGSLTLVHALSKMTQGPAAPPPAAHGAPPVAHAQANPAAMPHQGQRGHAPPPAAHVPQQPSFPQQPPPHHAPPQQVAPQQVARQQVAPQAPSGGMVARDPFAAPPGPGAGHQAPQARQAPQAPAPGAPIPSPPAGNLQVIAADLGAHSATNFYKGLSGNDIIDHGGLFVSTYVPPKMGSPIRLKVSLPGGYEFEANAIVKWVREQGGDAPPGFGAQITQITPEARQLVYRYVRNREPLFHDDF